MRAIPNLLEEVEVLNPGRDPRWSEVWTAEVLGHAIGHELRWWMDIGHPHDGIVYGDIIALSPRPALVLDYAAQVL